MTKEIKILEEKNENLAKELEQQKTLLANATIVNDDIPI